MNISFNEIIDLSHSIDVNIPHWPGDPLTEIVSCACIDREGYNLNKLAIGEHTSTHIGAPRHFSSQGITVDQIPIENLIISAVKIDLSDLLLENNQQLVQSFNILEWERKNFLIRDNQVVLFQTNWSRYWSQKGAYFEKENNSLKFPGISYAMAQFLIEKRKVVGIGIDSPGLDGGLDGTFKVSRLLAQNNIYHLENLKNLHRIKKEIFLFIGALPVINGNGTPCRVLAMQ